MGRINYLLRLRQIEIIQKILGKKDAAQMNPVRVAIEHKEVILKCRSPVGSLKNIDR